MLRITETRDASAPEADGSACSRRDVNIGILQRDRPELKHDIETLVSAHTVATGAVAGTLYVMFELRPVPLHHHRHLLEAVDSPRFNWAWLKTRHEYIRSCLCGCRWHTGDDTNTRSGDLVGLVTMHTAAVQQSSVVHPSDRGEPASYTASKSARGRCLYVRRPTPSRCRCAR